MVLISTRPNPAVNRWFTYSSHRPPVLTYQVTGNSEVDLQVLQYSLFGYLIAMRSVWHLTTGLERHIVREIRLARRTVSAPGPAYPRSGRTPSAGPPGRTPQPPGRDPSASPGRASSRPPGRPAPSGPPKASDPNTPLLPLSDPNALYFDPRTAPMPNFQGDRAETIRSGADAHRLTMLYIINLGNAHFTALAIRDNRAVYYDTMGWRMSHALENALLTQFFNVDDDPRVVQAQNDCGFLTVRNLAFLYTATAAEFTSGAITNLLTRIIAAPAGPPPPDAVAYPSLPLRKSVCLYAMWYVDEAPDVEVAFSLDTNFALAASRVSGVGTPILPRMSDRTRVAVF